MVQFGADQLIKASSYCSCPNCKLPGCLTGKRHRIDNTNSIQLWSCNLCHFNWKEIWSSYSRCIWSLQYQHSMQQSKVTIYKIC
jgi:Zn-finger protein